MPDITQITTPSGIVVNIRDASAAADMSLSGNTLSLKNRANETIRSVTLPSGGGGTSDTGWISATLTSEFALFDADSVAEYRKIGNIVFVRGTLKPTRTITSNATLHPIFSLPSDFAPSHEQNFPCQGTGVARWLLTVSTDGSVNFSRYGIGQYSNPGTSVWLSFSACFAVD